MTLTTFEFVREQLVQAGHSGISPADIFKALRESEVVRRKGTYQSFLGQFWNLVRLGWVEPSGITALADQRGLKNERVLSDRVFYHITLEGVSVDNSQWHDPMRVLYPSQAEWWRWYKPTGRQIGRPKKGSFPTA